MDTWQHCPVISCSGNGAVGGRDERPDNCGRGAVLSGAESVFDPFQAVLAVEDGFPLPDGTATDFVPPGLPWMYLADLGED